MAKYMRKRVWEIDLLRGIAILLMIFDHVLFDLINFYGINVPLKTGTLAFTYSVVESFFAGLFIFLSGISSSFPRSNLLRGLKLLFVAMALTLVTFIFSTYFLSPEDNITIWFGVLHCLAVSMLLAPLFLKLNKYVALSIAFVITFIFPFWVSGINAAGTVPNNALSFLGFYTNTFTSGDYFPLIPWMGVFIFGVVFGRVFYKEKKSLIKKDLKPIVFNYVGRYTLWIYLVHQPIVLGILYLIFGHI